MRANKTVNQPLQGRTDASFDWGDGMRTSEASISDHVLAIFQPDILIPEQFHSTYARSFHQESEKVLMLAVLRDAVACFRDNLLASDGRKQQLFLDANQWIMDETSSHFFSFENICDVLGLHPGYLRQGLLNWKDSVLGARAEKSAGSQSAAMKYRESGRRRAGVIMRDHGARGEKNTC